MNINNSFRTIIWNVILIVPVRLKGELQVSILEREYVEVTVHAFGKERINPAVYFLVVCSRCGVTQAVWRQGTHSPANLLC